MIMEPNSNWYTNQARSQPARWGGGLNLDGWNTRRTPPPLGHCPRDVINLKNAPTLGHSQAPPPPLDIARVTSSTYSKGGTKLLKGGTKLLKGGTKLLKGVTKLLKGGTKLLKGGTKLLKGGTKSLGWATGGGSYDPPDPPPPLATGLRMNEGKRERTKEKKERKRERKNERTETPAGQKQNV